MFPEPVKADPIVLAGYPIRGDRGCCWLDDEWIVVRSAETGVAPPDKPVPAPRETSGTPAWKSKAIAALASSVFRGKRTSSGIARCMATA